MKDYCTAFLFERASISSFRRPMPVSAVNDVSVAWPMFVEGSNFSTVTKNMLCGSICDLYGPFSYSEKESQSNDTLLHFVEFSNVYNSDRSSNATRSNLVYKNV